MKILVIEDDGEIRTLITYFLRKENYEIEEADNGLDGLKLVKTFNPDLIVLDLMLPNLDGINLTEMIRKMPEKYGNPYIIMLTAKTEIEDVLKGLDIGADDYMKKPFDPRELLLRIKKLLNRGKKISDSIIKYGDIVIDKNKYQVTEHGKEIILSKKEYDLLLFLIKNKGIVLTREKILNKVWSSNYYSGDRSVDVYVGKIRDKLKSISHNIKTIKGVGYRLDEEN
ncbi:two-component system alkaline phosphatase synthesis response regulator PhoP [Hypnocyclicus thermotrophus]|uniref:Two-component system alkaline phosphatase synthesis response regulator PhoP n=1 Tax=Hypnocyclicus thermotrophus TaxID=1627895 RepID=A0AA46DYM4_9FUSO|nr:response regulator transcription factor [Hypnocyclicus thermotrophus]TDT70549.1 two-component system alkaline phosphatase synthesis response regulator PhoP [Hypnocyclicus thermotrophus]